MTIQNTNELASLAEMIANGYIVKRQHPTFPIAIYNYTAKAQYENVWNEATLTCRGLICDIDGNVVARPFRKFFNLEQVESLPDKPFDVYEKLDGSLGILYWWDGKPYITTR
jgi:RNA ligase